MVYAASGIRLTERQRPQVEARAWQCLQTLDLTDFEAYQHRLDSSGPRSAEMEALLDLLAVHESYFFREVSQLDLIVATLLPQARRKRKRGPVRVWSAGCAAGEEPYSLAMLLDEAQAWQQGPVEILGTDFSATCLDRARRAVYSEAALRETELARQKRFFDSVQGGVRVREAVRRKVHFHLLNLYRDRPRSGLGLFDVILCRNVLLYFDVPARKRVVEALHSRLRPGGALLLGRSETLLNVPSRLESMELRGEILYRRKLQRGP